MAAGSAGAIVGTPAELALIRMTSDGRLPVHEQRKYKNVFDALYRVIKEEGVLILWRVAGFYFASLISTCRLLCLTFAWPLQYSFLPWYGPDLVLFKIRSRSWSFQVNSPTLCKSLQLINLHFHETFAGCL